MEKKNKKIKIKKNDVFIPIRSHYLFILETNNNDSPKT